VKILAKSRSSDKNDVNPASFPASGSTGSLEIHAIPWYSVKERMSENFVPLRKEG
jgi:hypothetical protein